MLRRLEPLVTPYIGKRDNFTQAATEARNRLVHASNDYPAPDYPELWAFAQQLGLVLEVAILKEIGFEDSDIRVIVSRGKRADLIRNNVKIAA